MRGAAGSAATAVLNRFVSTRFHYLDAIPPMFRFTIRDVLLVMVIVGLAVGWWVDRQRAHGRHIRQLRTISMELDQGRYSLELDKDGVYHVLTRPADGWQPTTPNRP